MFPCGSVAFERRMRVSIHLKGICRHMPTSNDSYGLSLSSGLRAGTLIAMPTALGDKLIFLHWPRSCAARYPYTSTQEFTDCCWLSYIYIYVYIYIYIYTIYIQVSTHIRCVSLRCTYDPLLSSKDERAHSHHRRAGSLGHVEGEPLSFGASLALLDP